MSLVCLVSLQYLVLLLVKVQRMSVACLVLLRY